jgi:hypothetical protein
MQMTFGKNRVQHRDFYWTYFRFDEMDVYYNEFGREVAEYAARRHMKLDEIEDYFDYTLDKRPILIIYNKKNDFRQSNVGLISAEEDYNVGGYSRVIKNKIMLWFNGDHEEFSKLIASAIAEVVVYEMIYNADLRDRTTSSNQIQIPDWYIKGLINYVAYGWDSETDNRVRDAFANNRYRNLDNLEYDEAVFRRPVILEIHRRNIWRCNHTEHNLPLQNLPQYRRRIPLWPGQKHQGHLPRLEKLLHSLL